MICQSELQLADLDQSLNLLSYMFKVQQILKLYCGKIKKQAVKKIIEMLVGVPLFLSS